MKFSDYIKEAKATKQVRKEIENFLKLGPDYILYNSMTRLDKRFFNNVDFLIGLLQKPNDTVTIGKHTLKGIVSLQLYLDKGKVKIDKT
jgi:hypothetical protein